MPTGVPVATVAIDNARNAGLLAARILALHDTGLRDKLVAFRSAQWDKAMAADERVQRGEV
jgi:5-(carboxyamino)imidazole ribonucleotide mutase